MRLGLMIALLAAIVLPATAGESRPSDRVWEKIEREWQEQQRRKSSAEPTQNEKAAPPEKARRQRLELPVPQPECPKSSTPPTDGLTS